MPGLKKPSAYAALASNVSERDRAKDLEQMDDILRTVVNETNKCQNRFGKVRDVELMLYSPLNFTLRGTTLKIVDKVSKVPTTRQKEVDASGVHRSPHTNDRNTRMHSSPSLAQGKEGVCFEGVTFSHLSGRLAICQKNAASSSTRSLWFLKKETDPTTKLSDDDEWIRSSTEAQEITADAPEESVSYDQQAVDPQKVCPIQIVEFLRKYVSRRLLALSEGEIASLTTAMRRLGVGSQGGTEALAIFHQLTIGLQDPWQPRWPESKWTKNSVGMIEWNAVRKAAGHLLPKHTATAGWKHRIGIVAVLPLDMPHAPSHG